MPWGGQANRRSSGSVIVCGCRREMRRRERATGGWRRRNPLVSKVADCSVRKGESGCEKEEERERGGTEWILDWALPTSLGFHQAAVTNRTAGRDMQEGWMDGRRGEDQEGYEDGSIQRAGQSEDSRRRCEELVFSYVGGEERCHPAGFAHTTQRAGTWTHIAQLARLLQVPTSIPAACPGCALGANIFCGLGGRRRERNQRELGPEAKKRGGGDADAPRPDSEQEHLG